MNAAGVEPGTPVGLRFAQPLRARPFATNESQSRAKNEVDTAAMNSDQAVQSLAEVLSRGPAPLSEDAIYDGLDRAGVPAEEADRVYKFAQVACGRRFLETAGVVFPDEYFCFGRSGEIMESGQLQDEPYFGASQRDLTPERIGGDAFSSFALMSAEVNAINNALHAGSKPKDLVATPVFLFLEEPTEAGLAKAQHLMSKELARIQAQNQPRKPWWKLW